MLIDDSLEKGGELETVGKKAFQTNVPLQKWWTEHKDTGFKVTPTHIENNFKEVRELLKESSELQLEQSKRQVDSDMIMKQATKNIESLSQTVYQLIEIIKTQKKN